VNTGISETPLSTLWREKEFDAVPFRIVIILSEWQIRWGIFLRVHFEENGKICFKGVHCWMWGLADGLKDLSKWMRNEKYGRENLFVAINHRLSQRTDRRPWETERKPCSLSVDRYWLYLIKKWSFM
jgi:hypothetical protein